MDDVNITMNKIETIKHKTNQYLHDDVVLRVEHLSKKFCRTLKRSMFYGTIDIMRSMLGIPYDTGKLRKDEFWALDDVSFELRKGETLGIIGENGSGKSTLLRLITGIFPPDRGRITFKGRIGALIAVGAGFHPHMTGRENVYLNGTILGMTRKEIDEKFGEIVEFADIGEFIDAPVNTYSSGMRVRLGFSIAVHGNPDILLVDEILSVGDLSFGNKSMRKMAEFREKANALIFISHNLEQVRNLCNRVIVLDHGKILFEGDTHEALVFYEEISRSQRVHQNNKRLFKIYQKDDDMINVLNFGILSKNGLETDNIGLDEPLIAFIDFEIKKYIEEMIISFALLTEDNKKVVWVKSNDFNKVKISKMKPGKYRENVIIKNHHLGVGVYTISFGITNAMTMETYTKMHSEKSFRVKSTGNELERGIIHVKEEWDIKKLYD